jgi:acyl carrier protein
VRNEIELRVKKVFFDVFNCEVEDSKFYSLRMDDCDFWDSVGTINLVLAIEEEFKIRLSGELSDIKSIPELVQHIMVAI